MTEHQRDLLADFVAPADPPRFLYTPANLAAAVAAALARIAELEGLLGRACLQLADTPKGDALYDEIRAALPPS